jgi:hypothetical protein
MRDSQSKSTSVVEMAIHFLHDLSSLKGHFREMTVREERASRCDLKAFESNKRFRSSKTAAAMP